jgi:geranylgeranyl diphosphate synthase type I
MRDRRDLNQFCRKILEDNGAAISDRASTILLEDPALADLRDPLEFISKNWRDLTPALIGLACEAVGGRPEATHDPALAISLMHLSFSIWDDIIDRANSKSFRPTLLGKYGEPVALVIAGLASAKAFSVLNRTCMEGEKHQIVNDLVWRLWSRLACVETTTFRMQTQRILTTKEKLWKIKSEASDLETCLKIGATLGNGSESEINHLGKYGRCLGIIIALRNDFLVSINVTTELSQKIASRKVPYSLLWAKDHSEKLQKQFDNLADQNSISQTSIREVVEELLATKAANNIARNIGRYVKIAKKELDYLRNNGATQTLRCLVSAQPRLFSESLY